MKKIIKQLFRFGLVGGICFLIDYSILYICTDIFKIHYLISSVISFTISTIFNYILSNLEESKVLGNLDVFVLNRTAITIERLENLDKQANENEEIIFTTSFKSSRDMYSKDFFRCCNELCLSPQSRAKLSITAVKQPEKKTLKDILAEDDE